MSPFGWPDFSIKAVGNASPEAQVKYLQAVLRAKQVRIDPLETELAALKLGREVEKLEAENQMKALLRAELAVRQARKELGEPTPLVQPKRRWFSWLRRRVQPRPPGEVRKIGGR